MLPTIVAFFPKSEVIRIDETTQSGNCCNWKRMEKLYNNCVEKSHFTSIKKNNNVNKKNYKNKINSCTGFKPSVSITCGSQGIVRCTWRLRLTTICDLSKTSVKLLFTSNIFMDKIFIILIVISYCLKKYFSVPKYSLDTYQGT